MNYINKVAIVTGASSGIGEATAKLLTAKGVKVVLAARSKNKLLKLSKTLPDSFVVVADVTKIDDLKKIFTETIRHFGHVDILVNNAGRGYDAAIEFLDIIKLHEIFDLDVVGPLVAMQQVIPYMRKAGGGAIVNISSGTALMALPNMGGYSGLKRALAGISMTASEELKRDHISVSVVYPYMTETNFEKNTLKGKEIPVDWEGAGEIPKADPPEKVALKILEAIETGEPEIMVHDWFKKIL